MPRKISSVSPLTKSSASAILKNVLQSLASRDKKVFFSKLLERNTKLNKRTADHSFYSRDCGKSNDFMEFIKQKQKGIRIIMSFDKLFFKLH